MLIIQKEKTEGLHLVPSLISRHLVSIVHLSLMYTLAVYIVHYSPVSHRANISTRHLYSCTVDLHHSNNLERNESWYY